MSPAQINPESRKERILAKRFKIGEPVNAAEEWAFKFLKHNLPDDYIILTNVDLPIDKGEVREIDAIVFGKYAIYLVDVKGYSGTLEADSIAWRLNGSQRENVLQKMNATARSLAGKLRKNLHHVTPWCQGMVFVTGKEGEDIELQKQYEELSIFDPKTIALALTDDAYITSRYKHQVKQSAEEICRIIAPNLSLNSTKHRIVEGFELYEKLPPSGDCEVWKATHDEAGFMSRWILYRIDTTKINGEVARQSLQAHCERLDQIEGITGTPTSGAMFQKDGWLYLPTKQVDGESIEAFVGASPNKKLIAVALLSGLHVVEAVVDRGLSLLNCQAEDVRITASGQVSLQTEFSTGTQENKAESFKRIFSSLLREIDNEQILQWLQDAFEKETKKIEKLLKHVMNNRDSGVTPSAKIDAPFAAKISLNEVVYTARASEIWDGTYITGDFDCFVEIVSDVLEVLEELKNRTTKLITMFHPNVERVLDYEHQELWDRFAVSKVCLDGECLDDINGTTDTRVMLSWFKDTLRALNYMHRMGINHGRVSGRTIICNAQHMMLVDTALTTGSSDDDALFIEDIQRTVDTFLPLLFRCQPDQVVDKLSATTQNVFSKNTVRALLAFHTCPENFDLSIDYLRVFYLDDADTVADIPMSLRDHWQIGEGYMTFVVVYLLNDRTRRKRDVVVTNALRSRKIVANETNKRSANAAVSKLITSGVIQKSAPGNKIALTEKFIEAWEAIS